MTPRAITIKEAAVYLSTTVPAIRQLLYSRQIPFVRVGKRFVIDVRDLDSWLERAKNVA
jgi:excisionase family DNA binding protein